MNLGGLFQSTREKIRERRNVEGLLEAFSAHTAPACGTSGDAASEAESGTTGEEGVPVSLRWDQRAVSAEATELLGRIGDARSIEPLLRMLKAGEEKA